MHEFRKTADDPNVNISLRLDKHKVDVDSSHTNWYDWEDEGGTVHKSALPTYPAWDEGGTYTHKDLHYYLYKGNNPSPDEGTHKVLEVYVCPSTMKFSKFVNDLANNLDPFIDKNKKDEDYCAKWLEATDKVTKKETTKVLKARSTSFLVIGAKQIQLVLYPPTITSAASSVAGDYQNTTIKGDDKDLIHYLVDMSDPNQTLKNCRKFFDQCYINIRNSNTWRSTGIILGVDAGVILLMGVMVFILTRGKNNPFRIYSFWDGQKIAYYACLTPGILALFGFLMSNMAMMLFILAAGVRVMWLSMRTLRYQAPNKQ